MSPGSYPSGGTWGCCWVKIFIFSRHGHVAYLIEGDGEQNGIQDKCSPYGQTCDLEIESTRQLSLNFFESVGVQHPIDYAITSTLIFLVGFKIQRLLFDCSFSFCLTPIDRHW